MELMGQWAPSVQKDQSATKKGLGDKLGWFAFPTLSGGAGAATDGVGGGNGIAVGKNAPPEAIDFLKFFMDKTNQDKLNTDNVGLSTTVGHGEHGQGPEPAGRPRRSRRGDVHAALPRPGDQRPPGRGLQRRHGGAVPRQVHPRAGLPGPHRRGCHAVGVSTRVDHS